MPDNQLADRPDHERIWLQNAKDGAATGEGRLWCQDKVWPDHPEDGEPTEYVRADLYHAARRQALEEAADFAGGSTMPRHEIADYLKTKGYNVPADMIHHALRLYMMPAIRAVTGTGGGDE